MNAFDQAAANLEAAKIAEAAATQARIDAEIAMLKHLPTREEGSVTERGLLYKVSATFGVNRTLDAAALESVRQAMPEALYDYAIEFTPKLKTQGMRYLQNNEPATYALLAQAITAKPAKPSVKVEAVQGLKQAA